MTDIQTEDNRHYDAHNRTHVKQTNELHSTNFVIFWNIDFHRSKGEFTLFDKISQLHLCFVRDVFDDKMWQERY